MVMDTSELGNLDEDARRRFEAAWQAGRPEAIEHFLPPAEDDRHLPTLEELVHIELEFAWKRAAGAGTFSPEQRPASVEAYLARFPRLNRPAVVRRLLEQEHLVRNHYGDRPSAAEYRARFPDLVATERDVARWAWPAEVPRKLPHVPG
jgi:hypothetical protein